MCRGVPENDAEAARLYRLAAEQDYTSAQYNLALRYATGVDVPMDFIHGHALFSLAAAQGLKSAIENKEKLGARMTSRELVEAEKLSVELERRVQR